MILSDELVAEYLPLARLTLASHPMAESLQHPLARLLAAAGQGVGHLPRSVCPVPENAPAELIAIRGDLVLLPRFDAFWQGVRSQIETRWQADESRWHDPSVRAALDDILPHQTLADPTTGAILFDNVQQRLAVAAMVDARLGVLTGGPGTGKTTSAAALLAVRKRLEPDLAPEAVLLCAPTGKAACRLGDSMKKAACGLRLQPEEQEFLIRLKPRTLHRTLEWSPIPPEKGGPFRRNASRPLTQSLVVVDEAGMMDLSLFFHLLEALPQQASLWLLGDRDQLESVETGGVLAELVARGTHAVPAKALLERWSARTGQDAASIHRAGLPHVSAAADADSLAGLVIGLKDSYRAKSAPGILALAQLLRPGADTSVERLRTCFQRFPERIHWHERHKTLEQRCREQWKEQQQACAAWTTKSLPEESALIGLLRRFQLLCGTNEQVDKANEIGQRLFWQNSPAQSDFALPHGCPLMITVNSYSLGLSNGDIGLVIGNGPGQAAQLALFPGQEALPVNRLPEHRPAFALTIHKSQGSEWDHVAIDLPEAGGILTPNLLYTAVTRSSRTLDLYGKNLEVLVDILKS